jgi:outer membrane protein TolC
LYDALTIKTDYPQRCSQAKCEVTLNARKLIVPLHFQCYPKRKQLMDIIYLSVVFLLSGCSAYHAKPLSEQTVELHIRTPVAEQLSIQAGQLKHPLLKSVSFDLSDGLSPDEAAILAVLHNPELRFARNRRGIVNAQLLQAGLLPNPRFSYNFAAPSGGLESGKVQGYGLSLDWEVTSLLTQTNRVAAASAEKQAIDLQIAWQEWQVAQAAKLACSQWLVYAKQQALLEASRQRLQSNSKQLQQALDQGLVTVLDSLTATTAQAALESRLQTILQQKALQQKRLNRALGLKPDESIPLQQTIELTDALTVPNFEQLTRHLQQHRLDLQALQQGYQAQEEQLRIAILQQFPKISIGLTHTKNNSNYYTVGAGIALTLPVFDQNQGAIALASATRKLLFDEYSNRNFQTKADIAELLVTVTSLNNEIQTTHAALSNLETLLSAYHIANDLGQIDRLSYYTAWNKVTDKKVDLLSLQLHVLEVRIALETATGQYAL